MKGRWFGGRFETLDQHLMVPELKKGRKMGALHHFSASAVAREGPCEGARGCLLMVARVGLSKIESREAKVLKVIGFAERKY